MLNGRIYRAAFVPAAIVLAIAAFSLTARPSPLRSTLAPDAFDGARALAQAQRLAGEFPSLRPGGAGDERLARQIAQTLTGLGAAGSGGFAVRVQAVRGQTIDGERTLREVIAQRPGSSDRSALVIVAHRDAAGRTTAASLSGTAALLELARVFAARETRRPIVLVSTSGGSGGDAGATAVPAQLPSGAADAAIVLGDLASARSVRPLVIPYSAGYGEAPDELQRTLADAVRRESGVDPGAPSALGQFVHLALPLAPGEEGVLNAAGVPAVLLQVSGERGPGASAPVSLQRLEGAGRGVLGALEALDAAPDLQSAPERGLALSRQIVPAWALRLLIGALLLPVLAVLLDGLARARRRGLPSGRWLGWTLTCALPFLACALLARALCALGAPAALPAAPVPAGALAFDATAATVAIASAAVLGLAWMAWPALVRRLGLAARPGAGAAGAGAAGIAAMLVLAGLTLVVWALDPYTALLLLPAAHLLLPIADPERRPRPLAGLGLLALSLLGPVLLVAFYVHQLGYGPGGVLGTVELLLAGGQLGLGTVLLWSLAAGCLAALALIALTPPADPFAIDSSERPEITIRGPLTYAGPGSLGGTESALRR